MQRKLVKFSRRDTPTCMDELDTISSVFWKLRQDAAIGQGIEGGEVLQISPKACRNVRSVVARSLVEPRLDVLERSSSYIKLSKVAVVNDKLTGQAHAMVVELVKQKANRPMRRAFGALPRLVGLVT